MSAGPRPYPAYKDSGVDSLGRVPAHWRVRRLGAIGRLFRGSGGTKEDDVPAGVPCVRYGDIYVHYEYCVRESRSFVSVERAAGYMRVGLGDILFAGSGETIDEIGKSVVCMIDSPACCGGDVIVFRPSIELDPLFMGYAADASSAIAQKSRMGRGITVMHIYADQLRNLRLALPPVPEQVTIARYLDYMDRRIRRYIRAKQKLIKLLEEQRQVIIHQAVTGQIDVRTGKPYPAYKDSGVEWLGQVPEHWRLVPLKFLSGRIQNGATPPTSESRYYDPGSIPWYGPSSCTVSEEVGEPERRLADAAFTEGRARLVRGPALLVVVIGATAGRMALLLSDGCTNQQITSFELDTKHAIPRFVLRQIRCAERWLRLTASTATIPILDAGEVSRLPVALPPVPEQTAVVRYLDDATANTDSAIAHAKREIELLREYRTRLIADVVTGKLDVREVAASLPDEAEEAEPVTDEDLLADEGEAERGDEELDPAAREALV